METEDLFSVEIAEDGSLGVEFAEDFLSLSRKEQMHAVETLFWEKSFEPSGVQDVGREAMHKEITMIFMEALLTKLKRGERIENDSGIEISFDELMGS